MSNLDKIMKPKSIAVIGASTKDHTIGSDIMKRLQTLNLYYQQLTSATKKALQVFV